MILNHEFVVEAPIGRVWDLIEHLDVVIPCMPGASYLGQDGQNVSVGMKIKLGVISFNFKGVAQVVERDALTHTAVVKGSAKDTGGKGATSALITARLDDLGERGTGVALATDLSMSGKVAQFGGSVLNDIAGRLVLQFADRLREVLSAEAKEQPVIEEKIGATIGSSETNHAMPVQPTSAAEPPALDLGKVVLAAAAGRVKQHLLVAVVSFACGWLVAYLFR